MKMLVAYDVSTIFKSGQQRLNKIAKLCEDYGLRVQNSVFECDVDPAQWEELKSRLLKTFESEKDSLRFYHLGSNWKGKVEHHGCKKVVDPVGDTLIL